MRLQICFLAATLSLVPLFSASAQPMPGRTQEEPTARLDRLEAQLSALQEELARLRLERSLPEPAAEEYFGQGPAMSKAFLSSQPLSWGATAEFLFMAQNERGARRAAGPGTGLGDAVGGAAGGADMRLFLGYRLSSNLTLHSALALADATPGRESPTLDGSEPHLDFALMDWRPRDWLVVRGGLVPAPVGERRLRPEPTLYADPLRSRVEEWVVPFDLSSPGVIAMAEGDAWAAHLGFVASPDVARLRSGTFLQGAGARFRGGRTEPIDRVSIVARLEGNWRHAKGDGMDVVISALNGSANHRGPGVTGSNVSLSEAHFRLRLGRLHWSALGALGRLPRAGAFKAPFGTRPGSHARGWTTSVHYELNPRPRPVGWMATGLFASLEGVELDNADGAIGDAPTDRVGRAARFGATASPVPNVTIKAARQWRLGSASLDDDLWQIAVGAVF